MKQLYRTVECCRKRGVPVNHRGRQLSARDFHDFHYILCMDDSNLSNTKRVMPKERTEHVHVGLLGNFDPEGQRIIEGNLCKL
jgi:low molecular weight phosphotyrosine protein phosphatase